MYRARYRRIVWFFARIIASLIFWDLVLPGLGLGKWSSSTRSNRMRESAVRFRSLAIRLGGVMIKVGQFLSTRVDILPPEITDELSGLQDEVPPVPFNDIRKVVENEFGASIEELFVEFSASPLAAASLGQVHEAKLPPPDASPKKNGSNNNRPIKDIRNVVVKVQRPNIDQLISTDLQALSTVGSWLQRYEPIRRRANVKALLSEFSRILYQEIDYLAEGRNAETFAVNFLNQPHIRVPSVIWTHTSLRVLTLENVYAIKITDYEPISKEGISRSEVASRLLDTYLQQIFVDGFFHADPHPGNLFVEPLPVEISVSASTDTSDRLQNQSNKSWNLTFVDFGMVGHIPPNMHNGLRELLIGVGTRDSSRLIRAYQQMDILLPNADLEALERAGERVFERYWGMNMSELTNLNMNDFYKFVDEFRDLLYDLPFQVPQDLIFLVRTVSILSGMCTGLDPRFNIFTHIMPFTQKLIEEEIRNNRQDWVEEIQKIGRNWLNFPIRLEAVLNKLEHGDISVKSPEISQQITRLEKSLRQITTSIVFAALLLGGIQLWLAGQMFFSIVLFAGAGLSLFWMLILRKYR